MQADPPVTAPYAFHDGEAGTPRWRDAWIAHCDPVHLAIGHDRLVLRTLAQAPLRANEARELFASAHQVFAGQAHAPAPALHLENQYGQWYLVSTVALDLRCAPLDAVVGRSVHEYLPTGSSARALKRLGNEVQMLWHASNVNAERESHGTMPVNAVWIHGGGPWQALPPSHIDHVGVDPPSHEEAILRGWMLAGATAEGGRAAQGKGNAIVLDKHLFEFFALQAWDAWLSAMTRLEDRIEQQMAQARARGATAFELVLCGAQHARVFALPLTRPWWRRLPGAPRRPALVLERLLAEPADDLGRGRSGP